MQQVWRLLHQLGSNDRMISACPVATSESKLTHASCYLTPPPSGVKGITIPYDRVYKSDNECDSGPNHI